VNSTAVIITADIAIWLMTDIFHGKISFRSPIKIKQIPPAISIEIWEYPLKKISTPP
jgi:hypothetical protein